MQKTQKVQKDTGDAGMRRIHTGNERAEDGYVSNSAATPTYGACVTLAIGFALAAVILAGFGAVALLSYAVEVLR